MTNAPKDKIATAASPIVADQCCSATVTPAGTLIVKNPPTSIIANAGFTFPEMKRHLDISKARVWAGLRPVSPAGTPLMGPTTTKGLFINAGHGHLGWTLSCGSGRVVADLVSGKKPEIPLPGSQGVTLPRT